MPIANGTINSKNIHNSDNTFAAVGDELRTLSHNFVV